MASRSNLSESNKYSPPHRLATPPLSVLTSPISPSNQLASLSRTLPQDTPSPNLSHTLHQEQSSVLSLAVDDKHIFSGSQGYDIYVWDRVTYSVRTTLRGHTGSVLALEIARDKRWLISSSGDSTIRIWSTESLRPLYILNPHLDVDSGDLFSLAYSPSLQTLYIGCQDTSLQWFNFQENEVPPARSEVDIDSAEEFEKISQELSEAINSKRYQRHRFFDSLPQPEGRPISKYESRRTSGLVTPGSDNTDVREIPQHEGVLQIEGSSIVDSAHYGYIYSMVLLAKDTHEHERGEPSDVEEVILATGSGDETVKLWSCTTLGISLIHTFEGCDGAVLSLVARDETIFGGCQEGVVKIWDVETKTLIRTIIAQEGIDILSLSLMGTDLYTCSANGQVQCWSASFDCTGSWRAHDGIVLSSVVTNYSKETKKRGRLNLVTGANDNCIKIWDIERPQQKTLSPTIPVKLRDGFDFSDDENDSQNFDDTMIYALSKFVSIPSVSKRPEHREDCRQAAIWLKKCLTQLGAEATMLPTSEGKNPLVLAIFHGSQSQKDRKRILFYGHYDVISAPSDGWSADPFALTGKNGYFYGRGTTDNKGPILTVACAASSLLAKRALECDLVFLIEGEEEAGSEGFCTGVKRHKDLIGKIDSILVSNSTWITDDHPCITYGLRGVVHCSIQISNDLPDVHSGIEGGAIVEPMADMINLLAMLSENGRVLIPGFYDGVRPQADDEKILYQTLATVTHHPATSFSSRWREPSFSIHSVEVSGPGNATVIPAKVKAKISLRIVPDQDLDTIISSLKEHLLQCFSKLKSPNEISVRVEGTADWWLGRLDDPWFKALEEAVRVEWGVEPLRIREGGSIPSVPYLEKEFGCHALHLPLGQSSDQAHLPNERISFNNLRKGRAVVERFLRNISRDQ